MNHPLLDAWHEVAAGALPPGIEVWDAHTHTGDADPDGFTNTPGDLLNALDRAGHAGAVVMTAADPAGYPHQNDRVLDEATEAEGRIVPFLRVNPNAEGAMEEVVRSLDAGHRGIKLHPRSESFGFDHPVLTELASIAAERRVPMLVHAGRGIPSLGLAVVRLLDRVDGLTMVLAHCATSDLGTFSMAASTRPGLHFDTAWWNPADLAVLFGGVDASRILYASDTPYGSPLMSATLTIRAAMQAGLTGRALEAVMGGSVRHLLDGEPTTELGVGVPARPDGHLIRVASNLFGAVETTFAGLDRDQPLELAIRATDTPVHSGLMAAVRHTVEAALEVEDQRQRLGLLLAALSAVFTPVAGHPDL